MFSINHSLNQVDIESVVELSRNIDNPAKANELHARLKSLKQGTITICIPDTISCRENEFQFGMVGILSTEEVEHVFELRWEERNQRFDIQYKNLRDAIQPTGYSDYKESVDRCRGVAEELNRCEHLDRVARRADRYSIIEQDLVGATRSMLNHIDRQGNMIAVVDRNEKKPFTASLLEEEKIEPLSSELKDAPSAGSLQIEVDEEINFFAEPKKSLKPSTVLEKARTGLEKEVFASLPSVETPEDTSSILDQPILVYGFENQRRETINQLIGLQFQRVQIMNDYNNCVGIGEKFKFRDYCQFIQDINDGTILTKANASAYPYIGQDKAEAWAHFLMANASKLNFARKLDSNDVRIRFLLKNYAGIQRQSTHNKVLSPDLKEAFEQKNWGFVANKLESVFNLLAKVGDPHSNLESLHEEYKALTSEEKFVLSNLFPKAFLRATSKLGLSFAREQGTVVLFIWKNKETEDLDALHNLLEVKRYKYVPPELRVDVTRVESDRSRGGSHAPEATTFSEMRELGRLRQKMVAPNYLLLTSIEKIHSTGEAKAVGSEAKGSV